MRARLPRVRFTVRRLMITVAVLAVLIAAVAGIVEWRQAMRPMWDDFRSFANHAERLERDCLRKATDAERFGSYYLAKRYRAEAAEHAERKRKYLRKWW